MANKCAATQLYGAFYYRYLLRAAALSHKHAEAVVDAVLAGIGPTPSNRQV